MLNPKNRIAAALMAALGAAAIGGGIGVAHAQPTPAPPGPPTVVDTPEPGDTPDTEGAADTDNIQEGDQNGPEVPDTTVPPTPPTR